jgi:predicted N-acetyltransferase YhbS
MLAEHSEALSALERRSVLLSEKELRKVERLRPATTASRTCSVITTNRHFR